MADKEQSNIETEASLSLEAHAAWRSGFDEQALFEVLNTRIFENLKVDSVRSGNLIRAFVDGLH